MNDHGFRPRNDANMGTEELLRKGSSIAKVYRSVIRRAGRFPPFESHHF